MLNLGLFMMPLHPADKDVSVSYEEDRQRAIIMRAKMRAEERIAQRYAEEGY